MFGSVLCVRVICREARQQGNQRNRHLLKQEEYAHKLAAAQSKVGTLMTVPEKSGSGNHESNQVLYRHVTIVRPDFSELVSVRTGIAHPPQWV